MSSLPKPAESAPAGTMFTGTLPPIDGAQPGALRGAVKLTLETGQALRLVKGRAGADKRAIIGLIGFA